MGERVMKPIPGFPHYMAVDDGTIFSLYNNITLKSHASDTGYLQVTLCENGKRHQVNVHRLIALAFIPNPNEYPVVNHKDESRDNNRPENLEWCTYKYNNNYGTCKKRQIETVGIENLRKSVNHARSFRLRKVVNLDTGKQFNSIMDACRYYGIKHHGNLSMACQGKYHTCGGYRWAYVEEVA